MMLRGVFAAMAAVIFTATAASAQSSPLVGVWRVVEVRNADGTVNRSPQPGLYMFTQRHYSVIRVNGSTPRTDLPSDRSKASVAELLAVYGNGLTAQSGTYTLDGDRLVTTAIVAKNPSTMAGNNETAMFRLQANELWISDDTRISGRAHEATAFRLVRVE